MERFVRQAAVFESSDNGNGATGRNSYLFKYACSLNARSVPEADALRLVADENRTVCRPPLPDREAAKCVESAYTNPSGFSPEVAAKCGGVGRDDGAVGYPARQATASAVLRLLDGVDLSGVELYCFT